MASIEQPVAARAPIEVAVLAFAESTASTIYGMHDIFLGAGRDWDFIAHGRPGPGLMRSRVVASRPGPLTLVNGVCIRPDATLDGCPPPDVVCVPDLMVPPDRPLGAAFHTEAAWIRGCYRRGSTIATACSGALLLAEAGLLDGEEATTHWAYCETLERHYPAVSVRGRRALVAAGDGQRLVMAGGGASWMDLALFLIARFTGVEAAMQVARLNLIDWHSIGQQPYARLARTRQVEDAVVAHCQSWIAEHYDRPSPVAAMVQLSGLPERSFKRRFQRATGMTPLAYVHTLRLEEAKQMLEASELAVEAIANAVGYEDMSFFSRLFRRQVGLTAAQYRRRFGTLRRVLQAS